MTIGGGTAASVSAAAPLVTTLPVDPAWSGRPAGRAACPPFTNLRGRVAQAKPTGVTLPAARQEPGGLRKGV